MECQVDSNPPFQINVNSDQWQTYAFSETLTEGEHQIKISFINDATALQKTEICLYQELRWPAPQERRKSFL